jgi:hypothetical protein
MEAVPFFERQPYNIFFQSNIDTNSNPKLSVSLKIQLIGHFITLFEIKNKIFKKWKKLILKNYELDGIMK